MNDEPFERAPMNNEPERKPTDRARARLEALLKANAAPRCAAGGNTCVPRSVQLDLGAPAVPRWILRTIYLAGIMPMASLRGPWILRTIYLAGIMPMASLR